MKLNIIGYKKCGDNELDKIISELKEAINILPYSSKVKEALRVLCSKIIAEQRHRKIRKKVWVKFSCSWSGYSNNPSAPRRDIGVEYRKIDRNFAESLPKYFCHRFTDGSTNDWSIKIVPFKPTKVKSSGYSRQVDKFLT